MRPHHQRGKRQGRTVACADPIWLGVRRWFDAEVSCQRSSTLSCGLVAYSWIEAVDWAFLGGLLGGRR